MNEEDYLLLKIKVIKFVKCVKKLKLTIQKKIHKTTNPVLFSYQINY